jgi:hypothetical protein
MYKFIIGGLFAAAIGCGGEAAKTTTTTVSGTVSGKSFQARDAVFNLGEWKGFEPFYGTTTAVQISDYASQCTYDTANQQPADSQTLTLVLSENDAAGGKSPATSTGDYLIAANDTDASAPNALRASAWYDLGGSGASGSYACFKALSFFAAPSGGKVTVTSVTADHIEGTFDITLSNGDHLTGAFTAPRCGTTCIPGGASCTGLNLNRGPTCP